MHWIATGLWLGAFWIILGVVVTNLVALGFWLSGAFTLFAIACLVMAIDSGLPSGVSGYFHERRTIPKQYRSRARE